MNKPRTYHYWYEMWKANVYVMVNATPKALSAFLMDTFDVTYDDNILAGIALEIKYEVNGGGHAVVIGVVSFDGSPSDIARLAHECFHGAEYIMERVGIKHSNTTTEAYAYTMDTLLRMALMDLMPKQPKRRQNSRYTKLDPQVQEVTDMKRVRVKAKAKQ